MNKRVKDKRFSFWVDGSQMDRIKSLSHEKGISLSDYAREQLCKKRPIDATKQIRLFELNKANALLNIIAERCEQQQALDIAVLKELVIIEALLRKLL